MCSSVPTPAFVQIICSSIFFTSWWDTVDYLTYPKRAQQDDHQTLTPESAWSMATWDRNWFVTTTAANNLGGLGLQGCLQKLKRSQPQLKWPNINPLHLQHSTTSRNSQKQTTKTTAQVLFFHGLHFLEAVGFHLPHGCRQLQKQRQKKQLFPRHEICEGFFTWDLSSKQATAAWIWVISLEW